MCIRDSFGRILREFRIARGISGRELARISGIQSSHISKFENGKLFPSELQIEHLADSLGLSVGERKRLIAWQKLLDHDFSPFLVASDKQFAENQKMIMEIEAETSFIREYQYCLVPGLLQTKEYSTSVFFSRKIDPQTISTDSRNKAIATREERKKLLHDPSKRFSFIISEFALRNRITSADSMKEQIEHLINLSRNTSVEIGIIPLRTRYTIDLAMTGFDIFDQDLALIENYVGLLYIWQKPLVDKFLRLFEAMRTIAFYSLSLIHI